MPAYHRRGAPVGVLKGYLDRELQDIERAVNGVTSREVTADTTILAGDYLVLCDPTTQAIVVTLREPSISHDMEFIIKQVRSNAHTVTLIGTVDGVADPVLGAENNALTIQSDGAAWWITGKVT